MGFIAMVQNDIKRVIAYSTLSQLGYMTVALAASAYSAAIFHLTTHAFFKALLFLCAGAVILAMHHDQDIRNMGGLRKSMPIAWVTSLIGTLALIGAPLFSGFYSKESIIDAVKYSHIAGSGFAYGAVMIGVFVTAFYSFRLLFLVFHGEERFGKPDSVHHGDSEVGLHRGERPHHTPLTMSVPLVLLAIPSAIIGLLLIAPMLFSNFFADAIVVSETHRAMQELKAAFHGSLAMAMHGMVTLPFFLMLAGSLAAWYCYRVNARVTATMKERASWLYRLLDNSYYLDKLNEYIFVRGARFAGRFLWNVGDRGLIDEWIINGSTRMVAWFAAFTRQWQSGHVYRYALVMILGVLAFMLIFLPFPFLK
jgi:NADH-quinone oxidoreductase subunit L